MSAVAVVAGTLCVVAGAGLVVWASVAERGAPGWRSNLGCILLIGGGLSALVGVVTL